MSQHPAIQRRTTQCVMVDNVSIGGCTPVVVQSMTNTDTVNAQSTAQQVYELAQAGSELVRITVNTAEAAAQVPRIRGILDAMGCNVPLIGDFHYNGHRLLTEFPECAKVLAKYRINPGNVGKNRKGEDQFAIMIAVAKQYDKPVRIGVNWGSLDQDLVVRMMDENAKLSHPREVVEVTREALIVSALDSARRAEELGLPHDRIVLSCKVSEVQDLIAVYRELARRCDYPLHLGLTEAGMGADHGVAFLYSHGDFLPRLRTYHQHGVSRISAAHSDLFAHANASVAFAIHRSGKNDRGGDGLYCQRSRRKQAGQYWHQPARYRRKSRCARVC